MTYHCSLELLERRDLLSGGVAVPFADLLPPPQGGTISQVGLERQDNLLTWYGQPVRLLAYGDYGLLAEGVFNHNTFFANLTAYGANFVRVWVNYHWTNELTPFVKTQGGTNPRYRLLTPNPDFYARLRQFVEDAQAWGVVVQVCLFDGVALSTSRANRWNWTPYNDARNVDVSYLQSATRLANFNNPGHALWRDVNLGLTRNVVDTLGDLNNVIYEVMNEPVSHGIDVNRHTFTEAVVAELYDRLQWYSGSKVIGVNVETGPGASNVFNWAVNDPRVDVLSYHVSSPAQAGQFNDLPKPVIISNDGDLSDHTYAHCVQHALGNCDQLAGPRRLERIGAILDHTFAGEPAVGYKHAEVLDKGLNGASWLSGTSTSAPNYNPRNQNIAYDILELLSWYVAWWGPGGVPGAGGVVAALGTSRAALAPGVLSTPYSVPGTQHSVSGKFASISLFLAETHAVLRTQYSVLSTQYSVSPAAAHPHQPFMPGRGAVPVNVFDFPLEI